MVKKGRPKKVRYVQKMPRVLQFSPRGFPGRPAEIELKIDEYEAMKLADFQDFDQSQGAMAMRLSRPSFGRILNIARKKIADAIVNGKIIKIRMGDAQIGITSREITQENLKDEVRRFEERSMRIMDNLKKMAKGSKKTKKIQTSKPTPKLPENSEIVPAIL